jgi:hypothetical protein
MSSTFRIDESMKLKSSRSTTIRSLVLFSASPIASPS